MAAITTFVSPSGTGAYTLRNVSAQATTGQTDWVAVPAWAKQAHVTLNITANAGTTPITTLTLRAPDPVTLDDTNDHAVLLTGAAITTASFHYYALAPTFTTAGTDQVASDSSVVQNGPLPRILGVRILNDRTSANETYTYTLTIEFKS